MFDPQLWNRYVYAGSSPLNFADPGGLNRISMTIEGDYCKTFPAYCQMASGGGGGSSWVIMPVWPGGTPPWSPDNDSGGGGGGGVQTPTPPESIPTGPYPNPPNPNPPNPNAPNPNAPNPNPNPKAPPRTVTACVVNQLGLGELFEFGAVAAGQPIPGTKRFVTPGSSKGRSAAGMAADWLFGDAKLPVRMPSIVGGPGTGRALAVAGTKSVARFGSRAVPIVGWVTLAYDVVSITACALK
jgi:hypothetical protein